MLQFQHKGSVFYETKVKLRPYSRLYLLGYARGVSQLTKIQHSIEEFGFVNPILVDEHNEIIAGHARLEAARLAHLQQVPVIRLGHLSASQKKVYRIADNKLAELGTWSVENLQLEFQSKERDIWLLGEHRIICGN